MNEETRERAVNALKKLLKEDRGDRDVPGFVRVQDSKARILPYQQAGTHGPWGAPKFRQVVHPQVKWEELPKLRKRTPQEKRNDTFERIWKHYQLYGGAGLGKSIRDELEANGADPNKPMTVEQFMAFATRCLQRAERENAAQVGIVRISPNTITASDPEPPRPDNWQHGFISIPGRTK